MVIELQASLYLIGKRLLSPRKALELGTILKLYLSSDKQGESYHFSLKI